MRKIGRRGITMALFLIINVLMISCGNAGPVSKEGQAATADGTIIDLAKVSEKIEDIITFITNIEEVKTLIKSVDELAKAIGQKIQQNNDTLTAETGHNGPLVAGAFKVILAAKSKLEKLETTSGVPSELKTKVVETKTKAQEFIAKLKSEHTLLGTGAATDVNAKKALDVSNDTKDKGASELEALN